MCTLDAYRPQAHIVRVHAQVIWWGFTIKQSIIHVKLNEMLESFSDLNYFGDDSDGSS